MDISSKTSKEVGNLGESMAVAYLEKHSFRVLERNVARKTGELDVIAQKGNTLYFVEVKTLVVDALPTSDSPVDAYDPSANLHETKIRKVARTGEWYVLEKNWTGDWQVDGVLVWIRRHDGRGLVRYLPQIA